MNIQIIRLYYTMIKKNYHENLRFCEKIKVGQSFIEADGLMKKIRKMNGHQEDGNIDAQSKLREIMCFWKQGWEYNHTHHTFIQPRITRPYFFTKPIQTEHHHPKLDHYYTILYQYITKLKKQNEDQTNYKIQTIFVQSQNQFSMDQQSESTISQQAMNHLIKIFQNVSQRMLDNFDQSFNKIGETMVQIQLDKDRMKFLQFVRDVCGKMLENQDQQFYMRRSQLIQFLNLTTGLLTSCKKQKMHSSVIAIQPYIGQLTYIIHPLCFSIYSYYSLQTLQKIAIKERGKVMEEQYSKKLQLKLNILQQKFKQDNLLYINDDPKAQEEKHSKIVFINLDGYQSQYNLQFMRNFNNHLMYISFPKFNKNQEAHNKRFYKKVLYNFTRLQSALLGLDGQHEDILSSLEQNQSFLEDPQKYHMSIDQLYKKNSQEQHSGDINKNVYIFPITFDELIAGKDISQEDKNIENFQSYFVRYLLRSQLYMSMKKFKPNTILISYTGKIFIQNQHFLQMMQQLQKICPKIVLFPNFTASLIEQTMVQSNNNYPQNKVKYDAIIQNIASGIIEKDVMTELQLHFQQLNLEKSYNPFEIQLFDKLSIFLKVTSGYYNIIRPYEEEQFYKKYNNSRVLKYIINLFDCLKNEYDHCKKKHSLDTAQISLLALEKNVQQHIKDIQKCVPLFYKNLFRSISNLLDAGVNENQYYSYLLQQLKEKYQYIRNPNKLKSQWLKFQLSEEIHISNMKYHEIIHIQLKLQPSKEQFSRIKDEKMDNLDSLFRITFSFKGQNQIVKIFQDVNLLYESNQKYLNKNNFYLILQNILSSDQQEILDFIAKPQINNRKFQRCKIIALKFYNMHGLIRHQYKFRIWSNWNYGQTNNHILLYWPKEIDYVQYYMYKMLGRKYEPTILNHIFIAKKNSQEGQSCFYQVVVAQGMYEYLPRWGSAILNIEDQIFIIGGFYHGEYNYLNDQHDITSLDLTDFNPKDFTPRKIQNMKKDLYSGQVFHGKLRQKNKVNTYVRPRMQFQFYDYDDLNLQNENLIQQQEDIIKIIMIGGYGQDFKTPYSLFVNYYYLLKIQRLTKRLLSIEKKYIKERVIPINVKQMIKNRGIFAKNNILDIRQGNQKQQKRCHEGITNNYHYFTHRVVYAIRDGQLFSKIKNLFAIQLYQHSKKDLYYLAKKLGQLRMIQDSEVIIIKKIDNTNHQIMVEVGETSYLYSLYYEVVKEKIQQYPLTHKCIIAMDTKKYTIYALISHSLNTKNRSILVTQTLKLPQKSIIKSESHYYLVLKELISFQQNLNLHTLIICNLNEIAILHGLGFHDTKAKQYLVKTKVKEKQDKSLNLMKKQFLKVITIDPDTYCCIHSFFLKNNNLIFSINFLQYEQNKNLYDLICYNLDLQKFAQGWKQLTSYTQISFYYQQEPLRKVSFDLKISLRQDFNNLIVVFQSNRNIYYKNLMQITQSQMNIEVNLMNKRDDLEKFRGMNSLNKIIKSIESYKDYDYFQ